MNLKCQDTYKRQRKMIVNKNGEAVRDHVRNIYGTVAGDQGLCGCSASSEDGFDLVAHAQFLGYAKEDIEKVPHEALMGLGSGNPLGGVEVNEGHVVLDLGCGVGLDSFIAARKVGASGRVIGIDMTEAMVERARTLAKFYGYRNVDFRVGVVEKLAVDNECVDVVISNCVMNLTVQKLIAFKEAYRVLKPGGCMVISDLVAEGELSDYVRWSFESWTGCMAGLVQKEDYLGVIREAGFNDPSILRERQFQKFGIGNNSGDEIKSILVRAEKVNR